jgi:hypothetical protein
MLEKEFKYYVDHQEKLVKKYNGKFLVIMEEKVLNALDSLEKAYDWGVAHYKLGTFLIQECGLGEENYTQHFNPWVIFK